MLREIGSVIAGYVVMFIVMFAAYTIAYVSMGADNVFQPGSYDVSTVWIVLTILTSIIAGVIAGYICARIARTARGPKMLAAAIVIIGVILVGLTAAMDPRPTIRTGDVDNFQAMQNAHNPLWLELLVPFIGAAGALAGARLRKQEEPV